MQLDISACNPDFYSKTRAKNRTQTSFPFTIIHYFLLVYHVKSKHNILKYVDVIWYNVHKEIALSKLLLTCLRFWGRLGWTLCCFTHRKAWWYMSLSITSLDPSWCGKWLSGQQTTTHCRKSSSHSTGWLNAVFQGCFQFDWAIFSGF